MDISVLDWLGRTASRLGDKTVFSDGETSFTFADVDRISDSVEKDHGQSAYYPFMPVLAQHMDQPHELTLLWQTYTWLLFMLGCAAIYGFSRETGLGRFVSCIGVLLMYCNLLTGMFTVFAIVMLHLQILQEEHYLTATFGRAYLDYRHQVLRYLGRRKGENGI